MGANSDLLALLGESKVADRSAVSVCGFAVLRNHAVLDARTYLSGPWICLGRGKPWRPVRASLA